MKEKFKEAADLIKATLQEWGEDKAARLAAALAYYTVFSIPPLLIIVLAVVGQFYDQSTARQQLMAQIADLLGREGADFIQGLLESASRPADTFLASLLSVVTLLLGATGVFGELQGALNTIWEVAPKPGRGWLGTLKDRFLSFTMVLGIGFLLLVSLVVSTALSALGNFFAGEVAQTSGVLQLLNSLVSFGIITLLFALIFKVIPDVRIAWRDVWLGALVTALLFVIGKFAIGLYLGRSSVASTYGAAGSLVIILLWIYYSAQILFLGAEFTQVYANRYGSQVRPAADAVLLTEKRRVQQGLAPRGKSQVAPAPSGYTRRNANVSWQVQPAPIIKALPAPPDRPPRLKKNLFYYVGMTLALLASLWFSLRRSLGR
ncbi:hypothetical protein TFLX_04620 [Thermoflexales bacterium]|nr:hypothetical protein TFLX_04620 [Thermoflexales bacterium]